MFYQGSLLNSKNNAALMNQTRRLISRVGDSELCWLMVILIAKMMKMVRMFKMVGMMNSNNDDHDNGDDD